jgi:hypothetical protein
VMTTTSIVVTWPPIAGTDANWNDMRSRGHPCFVSLPTHQTMARYSFNSGGYSAWRSVG